MVESIDTITLRQYFRIITSNPFSLDALGKGTDKQRRDAWKKIVDEDALNNKTGSHNRITELMEDRNRLSVRFVRIQSALLVLSRKKSESSLEVLKKLSIEGSDLENLFAVANDRINGLIAKINEIDKEIGDRKPLTMADCMREMMIVKSYLPVSLDTTLAEYRAAQQLVREMNQPKPNNNGKSDN